MVSRAIAGSLTVTSAARSEVLTLDAGLVEAGFLWVTALENVCPTGIELY